MDRTLILYYLEHFNLDILYGLPVRLIRLGELIQPGSSEQGQLTFENKYYTDEITDHWIWKDDSCSVTLLLSIEHDIIHRYSR